MPNTIQKPVELPIKSLIVNPALSGRTTKELADNAKEKAEELEAFGGWDCTHPGAIFYRKNAKGVEEPHLIRGFSRVKACELKAIKNGFFFVLPDDPDTLDMECIRSNTSRPISAFEQGRRYARRRDGTDVATAPKGAEIKKPMSVNEIAAAEGKTRQHIGACIGIFESPPEIGELIQEGKVAASVAKRAGELVKTPGKQLALVRAAVAAASKAGKDTATMAHLDAVKGEFTKDEPAKKPKGKPAKAEVESPAPADSPATPASAKSVRDTIITLLQECDDELSSADAEKYADVLVKAGATFAS